MALYYLYCERCQEETKRILDPEILKAGVACKRCGESLERKPRGVSTAVKEVLDDGIRPKVIERYADAERLYEEWGRVTDEPQEPQFDMGEDEL